jgi:hypothetical protein
MRRSPVRRPARPSMVVCTIIALCLLERFIGYYVSCRRQSACCRHKIRFACPPHRCCPRDVASHFVSLWLIPRIVRSPHKSNITSFTASTSLRIHPPTLTPTRRRGSSAPAYHQLRSVAAQRHRHLARRRRMCPLCARSMLARLTAGRHPTPDSRPRTRSMYAAADCRTTRRRRRQRLPSQLHRLWPSWALALALDAR